MSLHNIVSFAAGLVLASVVGLAFEAPPQVIVGQQEEDKNFVAISFFDCNELIRVVFLSNFGTAETMAIQNPMQLLDAQLRLGYVAYDRAYFVNNDRPCGIVFDNEET